MPHYTHDPATVDPAHPGPLPGQITGPDQTLPPPPLARDATAPAADLFPDPHLPE
jgi:hypothetical protein